jgi:hypothetical protein
VAKFISEHRTKEKLGPKKITKIHLFAYWNGFFDELALLFELESLPASGPLIPYIECGLEDKHFHDCGYLTEGSPNLCHVP